jgi:hypothetical protein
MECIDCKIPIDPKGLIRCDDCLFIFILGYVKEKERASNE